MRDTCTIAEELVNVVYVAMYAICWAILTRMKWVEAILTTFLFSKHIMRDLKVYILEF